MSLAQMKAALKARLLAERAADPRKWVTIQEAMLIIGLKSTAIGELVRSGAIESMKAGGARLLNRDSILEWQLAQLDGPDDARRVRLEAERRGIAGRRAAE
jgi:hypothetical protein